MNNKIIQLNGLMDISNSGHILYIYEDIEYYLDNVVSFILMGIELGHHLLVIDNSSFIEQIRSRLEGLLSCEKMQEVHFFDNHEFYGAHGDFHCDSILKHSSELLEPFIKNRISIRTWAHVEWTEQAEILSKLEHFENLSDHNVLAAGLVSVCAYNGNTASAALLNVMLRSHEYYMTDKELIKSNLYTKKEAVFPSLSVLKEHQISVEEEKKEYTKIKRELDATKHQLESFITKNFDPILIFNDDDILIKVNEAFEKVFGWSKDEILGLDYIDLPSIPADRKGEVQRNREDALNGLDTPEYESRRITKSGVELNVIISCVSLRNEEENVSGRAVIIRDITEQKRAQEMLIRSEKLSMAGELAASIAHEIRNPLTAVKGFLQLLLSGVAEKNIYYEIMSSEIQRIDLILNELLMLAKPNIVNFQPKNIAFLIQEVVTLLEAQANMYNVQIITVFENEDICLNCEENQIKQVFINFIKNAIEAMPKGGQLAIHLKCEKKVLLISFQDEGIGIPKHVISKLGEPFYTTKDKGTGLGFMVSKKIIEDHNGSVLIFSEENKGTTIEISIPYEMG